MILEGDFCVYTPLQQNMKDITKIMEIAANVHQCAVDLESLNPNAATMLKCTAKSILEGSSVELITKLRNSVDHVNQKYFGEDSWYRFFEHAKDIMGKDDYHKMSEKFGEIENKCETLFEIGSVSVYNDSTYETLVASIAELYQMRKTLDDIIEKVEEIPRDSN